jgi:hypothetical protein
MAGDQRFLRFSSATNPILETTQHGGTRAKNRIMGSVRGAVTAAGPGCPLAHPP